MQQPAQTPTVQSTTSPALFLERMEHLLLAQEARYGLMLGIALNVLRQPDFYTKNAAQFYIADDNEGIAAAALMTPPHGPVVYSERADARPGLSAIAREMASAGWSLPTVNGPEPYCTDFAAIWSETTGVPSEVAVKERTFDLRQVIHPTYSPGSMRQATLADLDLTTQWFVDFTLEALHTVEQVNYDEIRERVKLRTELGTLFLWEDGEAVSLAGSARPTVNGIAIGPVYTPPQFRGKGYASSCVAKLSQYLLDQGRTFCTLFTDLGNPTSNRIYQNIGYQPICDYTVYRFKNADD